MGVDIEGWVETWTSGSDRWDAACEVYTVVGRVYGLIAGLFGVRTGGEKLTEDSASARVRLVVAHRQVRWQPMYRIETATAGQLARPGHCGASWLS
jgi:hypothetical protein